MILIRKNSVNEIALSLTEKSSLVGYDNGGNLTGSTYPLFVFTNDSRDQEKIFTSTDISPYKERYNKFLITESGSTENLLEGTIHLTGDTSQWSYKVYESETPFSGGTLSITGTTGLVIEEGRVLVKGLEETPINDVYL